VPVFAHDDLEVEALALLHSEVDAACVDEDDDPVVEGVVLEGAAAEKLLQRAENADLLVVGFALAFVVGFERKLRGSPAGDWTFALVGRGLRLSLLSASSPPRRQ